MMNSTMIMDNSAVGGDDAYPRAYVPTERDFRFFLVRVFYPCLLIWGTIGNALCLRVLLSKKFVKNSTCQYLAVLAVIDILFIVMRSSRHIYKLFHDAPIFNTSKLICRILTFFSSALAHMASWILVIVSFDRYLIITSRYRRHGSTANRIFWSTGILIAIVALCNFYYFFIIGQEMTIGSLSSLIEQQRRLLLLSLNNTQQLSNANNSITSQSIDPARSMIKPIFVCMPRHGYEHFFRTYIPIFDILLVATIPFFLLCFTNIGIIIFTMRSNRRMRQNHKRSHRRHQRLTIMLLSVTLAFIGLTCPSVIFICVNKIKYSGRVSSTRKAGGIMGAAIPDHVQLLMDVCEALWYTKHAMNFILYTLSGQDFRREFTKLFTCWCHHGPFNSSKVINETQSAITDGTVLTTVRNQSTSIPLPVMIDKSKKINSKKSKKQTSSQFEPIEQNNNPDNVKSRSTAVLVDVNAFSHTPESVPFRTDM